MTALIVWNNGESYDNSTDCFAVDPAELYDTVKLLRLDGQGFVLAIAKDAEWCCEPDSLDEFLEDRALHICLPLDGTKIEENHSVLMQLSPALKRRVAKALIYTGGHHESHNALIEAVVEKLGGYEPAETVPSTAAQRMTEDA